MKRGLLILAATMALCTGLSACGGGGSSSGSGSTASPPSLLQQANDGIVKLQTLYNQSNGQWQTTGWWNAANAVTVLMEYTQLSGSLTYLPTVENTFNVNSSGGFLNNYYDDEGWWALAWIRTYDQTKDTRYLNMAEQIFSNMTTGWDNTCGGGIWWTKNKQVKNTIANELFLTVAADLAERTTGSQQTSYLNWAEKEWTWLPQSGIMDSDNLFHGKLDASCQYTPGGVWTYNQGVVLAGLAALSKVSGNQSLLQQAQSTALSAISHLTDSNNILHESCEPTCGADGAEFKGIFVRNLAILDSALPNAKYKTFLDTNAQSIWNSDRSSSNQFGDVWSGPYNSSNASAQISGIDCFLAADKVSSP